MKLTAICTLNDRSIDTMRQVFDSMKHQAFDEFIIVWDQTPVILADYCIEYWDKDRRVDFINAPDREPGWRSPVKAWNAGFRKATGDVLYCFSSETVQAEGNIERVKLMMQEEHDEYFDGYAGDDPPKHELPLGHSNEVSVYHGSVSCSCGPNGTEVNWNGQAPGNLFGDAAHPRPLGFIWAAPRRAVLDIGGMDEAFADGFWFDDADLFYRLWKQGLDFVFTDDISGTHLHHLRPTLESSEGQLGIMRNQTHMLNKYGNVDPMGKILVKEERQPGRTVWRHA